MRQWRDGDIPNGLGLCVQGTGIGRCQALLQGQLQMSLMGGMKGTAPGRCVVQGSCGCNAPLLGLGLLQQNQTPIFVRGGRQGD